jgi:hypothetical protein
LRGKQDRDQQREGIPLVERDRSFGEEFLQPPVDMGGALDAGHGGPGPQRAAVFAVLPDIRRLIAAYILAQWA